MMQKIDQVLAAGAGVFLVVFLILPMAIVMTLCCLLVVLVMTPMAMIIAMLKFCALWIAKRRSP